MNRQLAFEFPDRTKSQKAIRRAVGEAITANRDTELAHERFRREIYPGDIGYKGFVQCGQPSGNGTLPTDNLAHFINATRSIQVLNVIAIEVGAVVIPLGSYAAADPCVQELARRCSELLAIYHGPRPRDNQLNDAAAALLRPAAALVLGPVGVFKGTADV